MSSTTLHYGWLSSFGAEPRRTASSARILRLLTSFPGESRRCTALPSHPRNWDGTQAAPPGRRPGCALPDASQLRSRSVPQRALRAGVLLPQPRDCGGRGPGTTRDRRRRAGWAQVHTGTWES